MRKYPFANEFIVFEGEYDFSTTIDISDILVEQHHDSVIRAIFTLNTNDFPRYDLSFDVSGNLISIFKAWSISLENENDARMDFFHMDAIRKSSDFFIPISLESFNKGYSSSEKFERIRNNPGLDQSANYEIIDFYPESLQSLTFTHESAAECNDGLIIVQGVPFGVLSMANCTYEYTPDAPEDLNDSPPPDCGPGYNFADWDSNNPEGGWRCVPNNPE